MVTFLIVFLHFVGVGFGTYLVFDFLVVVEDFFVVGDVLRVVVDLVVSLVVGVVVVDEVTNVAVRKVYGGGVNVGIHWPMQLGMQVLQRDPQLSMKSRQTVGHSDVVVVVDVVVVIGGVVVIVVVVVGVVVVAGEVVVGGAVYI